MPSRDGNGWVRCDLGHRHWGLDGAAGMLVYVTGGPVLVQQRVSWSHHGGTWGLPGGARDSHETAVSAALREAGGRVIAVAPPRAPDDTLPDTPVRYDAGLDVRHAIGHADLILDGLLGIGGRGGLREPFATLAQQAMNSPGMIVAVDLPSGIDADTGVVAGPAVRAGVTVTFGTLKPGLLIDPGASHAGVVELVDIGLERHLIDAPDAAAPRHADIAGLLPHPGPESDKYRRGVLGLLAGSDLYTGAAVLAAGAAVRGGSGLVRLLTPPRSAAWVQGDRAGGGVYRLGGTGRGPSGKKIPHSAGGAAGGGGGARVGNAV